MTFEHKKEGAQHANTKGSRNGPGDSVSATGDAQGSARLFSSIRLFALGDTLREHRRSRPHMNASVDNQERITYLELDRRVNRLADALRKRGFGYSDRLLWFGQNSSKAMELLLACAKLGGIICPANWRITPSEFLEIVRNFDPKIVFWQDHEIGEAYHLNRENWQTHDRIWIQHDGDGSDGYAALLTSGEDIDLEQEIPAGTPLLAVYTAAFDGKSKAAQLSHEAILLQSLISGRGQAIDETSIYLVSGPMFHVGVLMGAFAAFVAGGCCVYAPKVDPLELLAAISQERVTHAYLPGPTFQKMLELDAAQKFDISSLFPNRDITTWVPPLAIPPTAPMSRSTNQYGQTELMGSVVLGWLGGNGAGRPAAFLQVRLLDDFGNEVKDGEAGEIAARGPLVMCGYLSDDMENAERTRDGWYRTRDLGRRNPDGSISFIGPKMTMIKSGLENIYPAEVENCIRTHPAVKDVCVIGVADAEWSQNVKAIIILRDDATATPSEIIEHCRRLIASYKKPKIVEFTDHLPRTSNGFIDRKAVDKHWHGGGYPSNG